MPTVWSDCHLSPILLTLRHYLLEARVNGRGGHLAVLLRSRKLETAWDVGPHL